MTVFMLVKTRLEWLALKPADRFAFVDTVIKPVLGRHPAVTLRFFDIEAFSAECTDVLMWTVADPSQYLSLVEQLRETPFWDGYFQILSILPGVEDGYAAHYDVERIAA